MWIRYCLILLFLASPAWSADFYVDNWDSASDPADWTSSNPTNQIDSGAWIGFYGYSDGNIYFDNAAGGDF